MASRCLVWRFLPVVMLLLLLPLPFCRGKYERHIISDKDLTRRKEGCYVDIDNGLWGGLCRSSWTAKENCALRCVSASCYNRIYGEDPLEEGEVDFRRGREYRTCLRREFLEGKTAVNYQGDSSLKQLHTCGQPTEVCGISIGSIMRGLSWPSWRWSLTNDPSGTCSLIS